MVNSNDKRVRRTTENIFRAICELITERSYPEITVTDIARHAHIDRKTFYLHYPSKERLFVELAERYATRAVEGMREARKHEDINDAANALIHELFDASEDVLAVHRRVIDDPTYTFMIRHVIASLRAAIQPFLMQQGVSEGQARTLACFYAGGIVDIYAEWVNGRIAGETESVARNICRLISDGVITKLANGEQPA